MRYVHGRGSAEQGGIEAAGDYSPAPHPREAGAFGVVLKLSLHSRNRVQLPL